MPMLPVVRIAANSNLHWPIVYILGWSTPAVPLSSADRHALAVVSRRCRGLPSCRTYFGLPYSVPFFAALAAFCSSARAPARMPYKPKLSSWQAYS